MNCLDSPYVLGISASHNGAACVLRGNRVICAVQEERLTRIKRARLTAGQPSLSVRYCLGSAGIKASDLSMIVVSVQGRTQDPLQRVANNPDLYGAVGRVPIVFIPHHYAHAVSALALSGFESSAILIVDGLGSPEEDLFPAERAVNLAKVQDGWESISLYLAESSRIIPIEKHLVESGRILIHRASGMPKFRSLGGMFQAASIQIFGQDMEAGKVMGLAPFGEQTHRISDFFVIRDGRLDFSDIIPEQFHESHRWPANSIAYQNLACSMQMALEFAITYLSEHLYELTRHTNLCYAGGVALNSIANEALIRSRCFPDLFIPPAAEDSGPALGAAFYGLWEMCGRSRLGRLNTDEFGTSYSSDQVASAVLATPSIAGSESKDYLTETVEALCAGEVVGWFQGGSELGPRALGQRSILFDPRRPDAKGILNRTVKYRETFRPFAPACLEEYVDEWFDLEGTNVDSPFMLRVVKFKNDKRDQVPAVVHVDGTGRLQTLTKANNGIFYDLVRLFHLRTGIPLLLNTSFNIAGEPIVETPEDALFCLLATGIDVCVLGNRIVRKEPGYTSILDLCPYITAKKIIMEQEINGGVIHIDCPDLFKPAMTVCTPWGEYVHSFPAAFLWVLQLIDGRRSGRELVPLLNTDSKPMVDAKGLTQMLMTLRRLRIIGFVANARLTSI